MRIRCRASRLLLGWWLLLQLLVLLLCWLLLTLSAVAVLLPFWLCLLVVGWKHLKGYAPDVTLLVPDQVMIHLDEPQMFSVDPGSFHCSWFCCLRLANDEGGCWQVIAKDAVSESEFHAVARLIWLAPS